MSYCVQKTTEQMTADSKRATEEGLRKINTVLNDTTKHNATKQETPRYVSKKRKFDDFSLESSTDEESSLFSDDFEKTSETESMQEEIVLRKSHPRNKSHKQKKDNTMVFLFTKYERLNKLARKQRERINMLANDVEKLEERQHFKNLELLNAREDILDLTAVVKKQQTMLKKKNVNLFVMFSILVVSYAVFVNVYIDSFAHDSFHYTSLLNRIKDLHTTV